MTHRNPGPQVSTTGTGYRCPSGPGRFHGDARSHLPSSSYMPVWREGLCLLAPVCAIFGESVGWRDPRLRRRFCGGGGTYFPVMFLGFEQRGMCDTVSMVNCVTSCEAWVLGLSSPDFQSGCWVSGLVQRRCWE